MNKQRKYEIHVHILYKNLTFSVAKIFSFPYLEFLGDPEYFNVPCASKQFRLNFTVEFSSFTEAFSVFTPEK